MKNFICLLLTRTADMLMAKLQLMDVARASPESVCQELAGPVLTAGGSLAKKAPELIK